MLFFLSGLPRSGSTVLAAILNQHPDIHVSATSGLIDLLGGIAQQWELNPTFRAQGRDEKELLRLMRSTIAAKYKGIKAKTRIDKSRGWPDPKVMATMAKVLKASPKIIATVRNVPDCAASLLRIAKPQDRDAFLRGSQIVQHLRASYVTLKEGFDAAPDNFLFVDYDDILAAPAEQLRRVEAFLGLPAYVYDLSNIDGTSVKENDAEVWNIPGLHDIAPKLEKRHNQTSIDVLGPLFSQFIQPRFWRGENVIDVSKEPLNLQLEASLRGDFKKSWGIAQQLERERPQDNRAAFNRGWHLLHQGNLIGGMMLLDRGRQEGVFGNQFASAQPMWDGRATGDVLLNLEGGLGDQIHGARFAADIAARGNRVILSCSPELAPLLRHCDGVSAVCQHEAATGVYHDYWTPSMTAVLPLGFQYENISGKPYIHSPGWNFSNARARNYTGPKTIGIRWQGNPQFEHEQHRLFPPELLFDAVKDCGAEIVSLQRDVAVDKTPKWARRPKLDTWLDTKAAIQRCDLVISSCTAVAHLAGALGVETWIATPILPYYLWAPPGDSTVWYDSVRLFRQTKHGDWGDVFARMREGLMSWLSTSRSTKTAT